MTPLWRSADVKMVNPRSLMREERRNGRRVVADKKRFLPWSWGVDDETFQVKTSIHHHHDHGQSKNRLRCFRNGSVNAETGRKVATFLSLDGRIPSLAVRPIHAIHKVSFLPSLPTISTDKNELFFGNLHASPRPSTLPHTPAVH